MIKMKQIIPFKKELLFKTKVSEITSISLEHTLSLKSDDFISGEFQITGDYKMTEGSINREKFSFKLPFDIALDAKYDTSSIIIDIDNFYYEIINNESLQVNIDVYIEGNNIEEEIDEEISLSMENTLPDNNLGETLETEIENETSEEVSPKEESVETVISDERKDLRENSEEEINLSNSQKTISSETENYLLKEKPIKEVEKTKEDELYREEELPNEVIPAPATIIHNFSDETVSVIPKNEFNIFENIDNSDTYVTYHVYIVKENDTVDKIIEKYGVSKEEIAVYNNLEEIKTGTKLIIPHNHE